MTARVMATVRVAQAGLDAIAQIAEAKGIKESEARREAFEQYVQKHSHLLSKPAPKEQ